MSKKDSEKAVKEAMEELEAAREAARLKAHLFSMDAKRVWEDLEGKVAEVRERIEDRSEQVVEASAITARDLARSIRKFVEHV